MNGTANRFEQDESDAFIFNKLTLSDNKINFDNDSSKIYAKIRAFSYPYLGAYIEVNGKKLVIDKARLCTKIKR